jgi:hypothetical protein
MGCMTFMNYDSWKVGMGTKTQVDYDSWKVVMGCMTFVNYDSWGRNGDLRRLWTMTVGR